MTPELFAAVTAARNALADRPTHGQRDRYAAACAAAGVKVPPPLPWPKPGSANRQTLADRRGPTDSGRPAPGDERNDR